ncbi:MAG: branched-chain amino acid ABC transporter permease [Terriglobales bacterium]
MLLSQITLSGITAGSVYALIALAFVLIYKGTNVIHFGLGDQVSFGAYLVVIVQLYTGMPSGLSIVLALIGAGVFGFLLETVIMRPIAARPILVQIIATLAIGLGIREGLRAFMGPQGWPFPFLLSPTPHSYHGIYFAWANLAIVMAALLIMLALYSLFTFSKLGRAVIATCQNRTGAFLVAIPVPSILSSIWIIASILAAVAGILLAPVVTLSPDMGAIGIKGFTVAALGGFTSLGGAVVAGFLLGFLETASGVYISTAFKDATTFVALLLIIAIRPQGLFGRNIIRKV